MYVHTYSHKCVHMHILSTRSKDQKLVGHFFEDRIFIGYWLLSHCKCTGMADQNGFWSAVCWNWSENGQWPAVISRTAYIHTYVHTCMHAYVHQYVHAYIHIKGSNSFLLLGNKNGNQMGVDNREWVDWITEL